MLRFKFEFLHVRYIIGYCIDDACVSEVVCHFLKASLELLKRSY